LKAVPACDHLVADTGKGATMRAITATLGALVCAFMVLPAAAQTALSVSELRSQVIGNSLQYSEGTIVHFEVDGSYSAVGGNGEARRGHWRFAGNKLCVAFTINTPDRCFEFFRNGTKLQVMTPYSRTLLGVELTSRHPATVDPSLSLTACEQTIRYALIEPPSSVSPGSRAFSGAWVGQWESSRCGALIVQEVLANDAARVIVGWGSHVRSNPGHLGAIARIQGNTLTANSGSDEWQYTLVNSATLDARFHSAGVTSGKLTRQK
jgi:hypothetical protein